MVFGGCNQARVKLGWADSEDGALLMLMLHLLCVSEAEQSRGART